TRTIYLTSGDGTKPVIYQIRDYASNTSTYTDTIILDQTSPTGTITIVSTGTIVYIKGTATDTISGIFEIKYKLDDEIWHLATPDDGNFGNATETFTISLASLSQGSHTISIFSKDLAGNISTLTHTFTTTQQAITIIEPRNNEHIKGIVKVSAICPDITEYVVFEEKREGSITWRAIGTDTSQEQGWSQYWDTPKDEATYTIRATAYNISNQALGTNSIDVEVDNIAPTGTLSITPNPSSRTITGNIIGSPDIKSCLFECGTQAIAFDNNLPFGFTLDILSWNAGTYTFTATIEDEVGNKGTTTASVLIDNIPPYAQIISINGYAPGSKTLFGTATIFFAASDTTTSILGIPTLLIDGIEIIPQQFLSPYGTLTFNTTKYADGAHSLQIKAIDTLGNIGYSPLAIVNIKNGSDRLIILTPPDYSLLNKIVGIEAIAPALTSRMLFSVSTDSLTWLPLATDTTTGDGWKATWNTTLFPDGTYTLRAKAYDQNNTILAEDTNFPLFVDNTPPDISKEGTITTIPNLKNYIEIYFENTLFKGSASNTIKKIYIELEGGIIEPIATIDGEFRKIISLKEGTNTIIIYLEDNVGNVGSKTFTIVYKIPKVTNVLGKDGGIIINPNGSTIEIPQDATLEEKRISFNIITEREEGFPQEQGILFLKTYHSLSNLLIFYEATIDGGGYVFHSPVKLVLAYDDSNWDKNLNGIKDSGEIDEARLSVFFYDEIGRIWIKIGGVVDPINNTITVWVNHFSLFALGMELNPAISSELDVYLERNPFKLGQDTTFVFSLPKPGRVYLRIFDLAGDLVRELMDGSHYQAEKSSAKWNGLNDVGDRYVGSGIYIYQFRVEYDDGKKEQIIKPIGVVK
ncbi:MAG: hypothetical protein AB1630_00495, partial [bacterium]